MITTVRTAVARSLWRLALAATALALMASAVAMGTLALYLALGSGLEAASAAGLTAMIVLALAALTAALAWMRSASPGLAATPPERASAPPVGDTALAAAEAMAAAEVLADRLKAVFGGRPTMIVVAAVIAGVALGHPGIRSFLFGRDPDGDAKRK